MPALFAHQQKAREKYRHESRIPLFFDAGTGKTLTALASIEQLFRDNYERLAVIIICPY